MYVQETFKEINKMLSDKGFTFKPLKISDLLETLYCSFTLPVLILHITYQL